MRAMRAFDTVRGDDFRPWFLTIVRNTSFNWLSRNRQPRHGSAEASLDIGAQMPVDCEAYDPQALALRAADVELVRQAIDALPDVWREVIALREMEGLSYKEIAKIVGVPMGTVMSRLARGRTQLQELLMKLDPEVSR